MELSSNFCRIEEHVQRDRAANAALEHIRLVAEKATKAWGAVAFSPNSAKRAASEPASSPIWRL